MQQKLDEYSSLQAEGVKNGANDTSGSDSESDEENLPKINNGKNEARRESRKVKEFVFSY